MAEGNGKAPLLKFEKSGDEKSSHLPAITLGVALVIAAAVYIAGVMFGQALLTGLAFFIGLAGVLLYMVMKRKFGYVSDIDIDEEVEQYKRDLVDTFNGYDVDFSAKDIETAADAYRQTLEEEAASVSEINLSTMSQVVADNLKKKKKKREEKRK